MRLSDGPSSSRFSGRSGLALRQERSRRPMPVIGYLSGRSADADAPIRLIA
jgi:hypothetical protein